MVWAEKSGPPPLSVRSHYSAKQARSNSIFHVQRWNTNDSGFGYPSLGVHMVDMIMSITERIKATFADGGWHHPSCDLSVGPFVCLQSSLSTQRQLTLEWPDVGLILSAAVPIKHKDPSTLEGLSNGYSRI